MTKREEKNYSDPTLYLHGLLKQERYMSPISPFGDSVVSELMPIMENSEQSENITYFSDSHLKLSYDELMSI